MAYMNFIGNGTEQNTTRFYDYLNLSLKFEPGLYTPIQLMKLYAWFNTAEYYNLLDMFFEYLFSFLENKNILIYTSSFFVVFYICFFISLKLQDS